MGTPTRLPKGISTEPLNDLFGNYIKPNPLRLHQYVNDFDTYAAADWTVTATTGTTALAAGNGGKITQTTAATLNDIQSNKLAVESFQIVAGEQLWFVVNIEATTAATSDLLMGLTHGGTAFAPTDGLYFTKAAASASISFVTNVGSTATTYAGIATLSDGAALSLGFYYDGKPSPTLYVYANDTETVKTPRYGKNAAFCGPEVLKIGNLSSAHPTLTLTATTLAPEFGIKSAGAAEAMTTDFIMAANEVAR